MDHGPAFAERLKTLISSAKARLDDARNTASQRNASTTADERSAQQAEASARASQREASRAVDALPSDTRSKLAAIKKKCAALRDAEKDAARHLDEDAETEDETRAVGRALLKTAEDLRCVRVGSHRQGRRRLGPGDSGRDASGAVEAGRVPGDGRRVRARHR